MHLSRHLDHISPLNFRFKYASYIRRCFCSFRCFPSTPSSTAPRSDSRCSNCVPLKNPWRAMSFDYCPILNLRFLSDLRCFISPLLSSDSCLAILLTMPRLLTSWLPCITLNTSRQCTKTFLSVSYMVSYSDKKLGSFLSHYDLRQRRLYRTLRYLGLHPPVSFICAFEGRTTHADSNVAFRSRPGFTSSPPRKFMFGMTTSMFVLGITTLVLETTVGFQQTQLYLDLTGGDLWISYRTNIAVATFSRLMVRLLPARCSLTVHSA